MGGGRVSVRVLLIHCCRANETTDERFTAIVDEYLEGQGNLVSRSIIGINKVTMWVIGGTNILTKSP